MRFENPYLLFFLILIPATAAVYFYAFLLRKKALDKFGQGSLLDKLSTASVARKKAKAALTVLALFFVVIALARPQFGTKLVEIKRRGSDIVLAVDVSLSMLAEDVKPNRIERSKLLLSGLLQQLEGNKVGIVAFAGTAFWQCPLTLDITAANLFLQQMNTNLIPVQGTVIGDAIRLAVKGLSKTSEKSKSIVILTDGEDHKSDPLGAAEEAAKAKIKIFAVGIGSKNGEPIPVKDESAKFIGYKKDKNGNIVMSKMDIGVLEKIAEITGGQYFDASSAQTDIGGLVNAIRGLEKSKLSANLNRQYEEKYQYFLFLALLLLIIEYFIPETKGKKR